MIPAGLDGAPPWLVSAVIHVVLVIIMALIYSVQYIPNEVVNLDVNWDEKEGEQLQDDKFEMKVEDPSGRHRDRPRQEQAHRRQPVCGSRPK